MKYNAENVLKKYFGYKEFKPNQKEIIENINNSRDVIAIMPTGSGKSICYQIPAIMLEGITIVISPLISLMKDQVDALNNIGINAAYINSTLDSNKYFDIISEIRSGKIKIIYVAPEKLEANHFLTFIRSINISLVAIDEAHCISQWGHDFRPSYLKITEFINTLDNRPVVATFTATATDIVKRDIVNQLKLINPFVSILSCDRPNLYFDVKKPDNKSNYLLNFINTRRNESGIVYCSTRKNVDELFEKLLDIGLNVTKYHAGLSKTEREINQSEFVNDEKLIMIATNAFGMGIDKSNIRYVVHYNMPKSLENYYQEAGRAGRDGLDSYCVLLYNVKDIVTNKFLINNSSDTVSIKHEYEKLNSIINYANTTDCLRHNILHYFGDKFINEECANCENCLYPKEKSDITEEAQKIISCIKRMNQRFGISMVTDVLKGSKTKKIDSFGFDKLSTYGIMPNYSKATIREIISSLISKGYLDITDNQYPIILLTKKAHSIITGDEKVYINRIIEKQNLKIKKKNIECQNPLLFEELRNLRKEVAKKENVPPFIVFSDASLIDISNKLPLNQNQFINIKGVGHNKLEKYSEIFLNTIKNFLSENKNIKKVMISNNGSITNTKNTRSVTYEYYLRGMSINEISEIRNLSNKTIEGHLVDCYINGDEIDIDKFVPIKYRPIILGAIKNVGIGKLKPLKEQLPEEISYFMIRLIIEYYKKNEVLLVNSQKNHP